MSGIEALGVGASVVAIIQITDRIVGFCKFFLESLQDAPSDLRVLLIEISTLRTILENLRFLNGSGHNRAAIENSLSGKDGPLDGCQRAVSELEKLLPLELMKRKAKGKKKMGTLTLAALAWPMREKQAKKLIDEILNYKVTIALALTTSSLEDIKTIKTKTQEMHDMLTDGQRQNVYKWLHVTDPSPLHYQACKNYTAGTGNWMLRSPQWQDWIKAKQRCLWIHGIPGAGKTVLLSYLTEQIEKHCADMSDNNYASVYYYCSYGHNQDEAGPFLRWILNRLCRMSNYVPNSVYRLYNYGGEPTLVELLAAIEGAISTFERVYIIFDAVDESHPREDLLKVIRDIATDLRFKNLQLLVSSREYLDIEHVMEGCSIPVSMSNSFVTEDIRCFVQSTLERNPKFKHWPEELFKEVEDAVSIQAKGMFRWAVCQLDSLQRLKPDRQTVRKALKNLPKTLDESYDRIFIRIPEEDRLFFYHALHWISYHQEQHSWNIPCSILLQAAARSTTEINDSQRDLYLDKNILKEVLGRLITITSEKQHSGDIEVDTVTFSHYTVREYLDSSRILKAKTSAVAYRQGLEERFLKLVFREALHGVPNELWNKVDYSLELSDLHAAVKVDPEDYIKLDNINDVFTLNGNLKKEFLGVPFSESATKLFKETFRYPNVLKIYEHWKEHIGSIPKPDIHSAIQQSFNTYAMLSAIHCLYDGQAKLGQYDGLDTLAFAFLTPFQKHYSTLCTAANIMESKVGILDDDSWYGDDRFWHVRWLLDSGNTDVVVLFSLLLLSMYSQRNLILAKRFLSRIELNKVLNIPLIIQKKTWDPDLFRKGWYFYAGTLPDILAQLMMEDTTPFRLLLDDAQEHFNLSRALISYIGSHDHDVLSDDRKDCPLERLLELGADFSGSGYKVTPLQIAVHCWSIEAVDLLLKAGADPNGVGEVDGTAWMPGTYLARFNALHGATPLYICRVFDCTFKDDKMSKRKANRELIEASLVKYNAEASIKQ